MIVGIFQTPDYISCVAGVAGHILLYICAILWGVICVKFHRHSVQAQLTNMQAQHEGTTFMHNMRAQHEGTT